MLLLDFFLKSDLGSILCSYVFLSLLLIGTLFRSRNFLVVLPLLSVSLYIGACVSSVLHNLHCPLTVHFVSVCFVAHNYLASYRSHCLHHLHSRAPTEAKLASHDDEVSAISSLYHSLCLSLSLSFLLPLTPLLPTSLACYLGPLSFHIHSMRFAILRHLSSYTPLSYCICFHLCVYMLAPLSSIPCLCLFTRGLVSSLSLAQPSPPVSSLQSGFGAASVVPVSVVLTRGDAISSLTTRENPSALEIFLLYMRFACLNCGAALFLTSCKEGAR